MSMMEQVIIRPTIDNDNGYIEN